MALEKRPVFLNLIKIRLPVAGVMSIIHRASGVVMVFSIPFLLYLLQGSLKSEQSYQQIVAFVHQPVAMVVLFLMMWSLMHHLFAGIRYMLIDIDIGVEAPVYRYSAWVVMLLSPIAALVLTGGML